MRKKQLRHSLWNTLKPSSSRFDCFNSDRNAASHTHTVHTHTCFYYNGSTDFLFICCPIKLHYRKCTEYQMSKKQDAFFCFFNSFHGLKCLRRGKVLLLFFFFLLYLLVCLSFTCSLSSAHHQNYYQLPSPESLPLKPVR